MKLPDRLHCPNCKGRLAFVSTDAAVDGLRCTGCQRIVPVRDGIADFVGDMLALDPALDRCHGGRRLDEAEAARLLTRIQTAAGDRWPNFLGDTIEFGCGSGEVAHAIAASQKVRSLLVLDTGIEMLRACQAGLASLGFGTDWPVGYATFGGIADVIRDAVADTVFGLALLSGIGDVRAFLAMVHRVLKPGGRAMFIVPNRRYHEAMCLAIAEALVRRRVQDGAWPEGQPPVLEMLARTKRLLLHAGDLGFLSGLEEKHLFGCEALQDLCGEVGFETVETLPLDPDPIGAATVRRICQEEGAPDTFAESFSVLTAGVGKPFFDLLGRQDSSASMLLWLTKASGPKVRVFTPHPPPPQMGLVAPEAALGGAAPRWSVELVARETEDGILLSVGGWCLCNTGVLWVRLTLDGIIGDAPVWRPRPDVHDVLNRSGLYYALNAICSGLASEILFKGARATDGTCTLRLEVILASGLVVTGPAPDTLTMNEQVVIAH